MAGRAAGAPAARVVPVIRVLLYCTENKKHVDARHGGRV